MTKSSLDWRYAYLLVMLLLIYCGASFTFTDAVASEILAPTPTWSPPSQIESGELRMRWLDSYGVALGETNCSPGDAHYGCTVFCDNQSPYTCASPVIPYPYGSAYPTLSYQNDYLLDVVAQETNPNGFADITVNAEAIVARSYAYHYTGNKQLLENSTTNQAFIPWKFDSLNTETLDNPAIPCASNNLNDDQHEVCNAVGSGYYLSWDDPSNPTFLPARTNFVGDIVNRTTSSGDRAYLIGVEEPVSNLNTPCPAANTAGITYGMSQEGANRWAEGNQCGPIYYPDSYLPWNVQWTRTEQILFHYYTDVHIRDNNKQIVTALSPVDRWNPLKFDGALLEPVPVLVRGATLPAAALVQNTGLSNWTCDGVAVSNYRLRYWWQREGHVAEIGEVSQSLCGLQQGSSAWTYFLVGSIPNWGYGYYTLQFDIVKDTPSGDVRFSPAWATYDKQVFVFPTSLSGGYTSPAAGAGVNYAVDLTAQVSGDGNSAGVTRATFQVNVGGAGWVVAGVDDHDCAPGNSCVYAAVYSLNGIRNQTELVLRVNVEDQAGNVQEGLGGTRSIVIHDDPPTISLDTANGNASTLIWSNQSQWTFAGTASDPENHLGALQFRCSGDSCGVSGARSEGAAWTHTQQAMWGQVDIAFAVSDPALNEAVSRRLDLRIDGATPVTTLTLNSAAPKAWYSGTVQARLTAVDRGSGHATSGVGQIQYRVDAQTPQTHSGDQVDFTVSGEGQHTVRFYASDVVSNAEAEQQAGFGIDNTAPTAGNLSVISGSGLGNCPAPTGTVWIAASASAAGSGVRRLRLSNDGVIWSQWRAYSSQTLWALPSESAPGSVYLQVQDGVGWISTPISRTLSYAAPDVWCAYMPVMRR